jgi:hypothetical protein
MSNHSDRASVLQERGRQRLLKRGIGLYTYQQVRNTTRFQFVAQIVVGVILVFAGFLFVYAVREKRLQELSTYGSAGSHWGGLCFGFGMMLYGVFLAHPGIIFCWRKFIADRGANK